MRMNNLSARLIANFWLKNNGHQQLSSKLSYQDFATQLRKVNATTCIQQEFTNRTDACAYIRNFASSKRHEIEATK